MSKVKRFSQTPPGLLMQTICAAASLVPVAALYFGKWTLFEISLPVMIGLLALLVYLDLTIKPKL